MTAAVVGGGLALAAATDAWATGWTEAPPSPFEFSANVAIATDYVFRGVSQSDESPAVQGGFDLTYGSFYAGVWASSLDFGGDVTPAGESVDIANMELDAYFGVKKSYNGIEFDLGAIYYHYPNAYSPGARLDFWEFKFGVARDLFGVATATTVYWSPNYTGEVGDTVTWESSASKEMFHGIVLEATLGRVWNLDGNTIVGDLADPRNENYVYWNVGLAKTFHDKFTFDVRYWDTNAKGCGSLTVFQCDARVVGTLSASF